MLSYLLNQTKELWAILTRSFLFPWSLSISVQREQRPGGCWLRSLARQASASRRPAALPAACEAGWGLRSFHPRGGIAGKADDAAFLTEGKEDSTASGVAACLKTVVTSVH